MIGSAIKAYLKENGIKQNIVAERSNMKIQTLNAILNEQRRLEAEEYFVICNAIGLPVDYFASKLGYIEVVKK